MFLLKTQPMHTIRSFNFFEVKGLFFLNFHPNLIIPVLTLQWKIKSIPWMCYHPIPFMQEGQVIDVFRSDPILTCCRQLQNVQVARTSQYHILHQSSSSSAQLEKLNVDFPVSWQLPCWLHPSLYDFNFLWNWLGYSPSLNSQKCVVKFHKMFSRINLHFCERSKNTNVVVSLKKRPVAANHINIFNLGWNGKLSAQTCLEFKSDWKTLTLFPLSFR